MQHKVTSNKYFLNMQQPCYKSNLWPRKSKCISAKKKLIPCKNSSYQIGFKKSIWGLINVYVCVCRMKIFHLVTLTRCSASQQMSSELQRLWPTYGTNPCPINCLRNCDGLPNLCQILTSAHKWSHSSLLIASLQKNVTCLD